MLRCGHRRGLGLIADNFGDPLALLPDIEVEPNFDYAGPAYPNPTSSSCLMIRTAIAFSFVLTVPVIGVGAVTFDWANVGNAGNAGELSGAGAGGSGPDVVIGAVDYAFRIGKHEVTNAQYAVFLNAVAATDNFGGADPTLYHPLMSNAHGGIIRRGLPGSHTYITRNDMSDKPVLYVSFIDAMRFTNWLHNGQGSGDTETGAYTISNGLDEIRAADAKYWIPSEDEWYKAAYHDASAGTAGVYFDYAIGSDSVPTLAWASGVGDISNPGQGVVNYDQGAVWGIPISNVTTVGSAGPASVSPYGTFDQNGNAFEWNEAVISSSFRGLRGGDYRRPERFLRADWRAIGSPDSGGSNVGFRIATRIPEPATLSTVLVTAAVIAGRRGRRGS